MRFVRYLQHWLSGTGAPLAVTDFVPLIEILRETPSFRAGRKGGGPCGATAEPSGGVEAPAFRPGRTSTVEHVLEGFDDYGTLRRKRLLQLAELALAMGQTVTADHRRVRRFVCR